MAKYAVLQFERTKAGAVFGEDDHLTEQSIFEKGPRSSQAATSMLQLPDLHGAPLEVADGFPPPALLCLRCGSRLAAQTDHLQATSAACSLSWLSACTDKHLPTQAFACCEADATRRAEPTLSLIVGHGKH